MISSKKNPYQDAIDIKNNDEPIIFMKRSAHRVPLIK